MPNIAQHQHVRLPQRMYRLRWRFDFVDGRVKRGIWMDSSGKKCDGASHVNKNGLIRACIEGEHVKTFETVTFVEVEGPRYVSTQWDMVARMRTGFRGEKIGLSFLTDKEKVSVLVNGQVGMRDLTQEERKFKLAEYK